MLCSIVVIVELNITLHTELLTIWKAGLVAYYLWGSVLLLSNE